MNAKRWLFGLALCVFSASALAGIEYFYAEQEDVNDPTPRSQWRQHFQWDVDHENYPADTTFVVIGTDASWTIVVCEDGLCMVESFGPQGTFQEQEYDGSGGTQPPYPASSSPGGSIEGGSGTGTLNDGITHVTPVYVAATVCSPGGCTTEWVLIGYQNT